MRPISIKINILGEFNVSFIRANETIALIMHIFFGHSYILISDLFEVPYYLHKHINYNSLQAISHVLGLFRPTPRGTLIIYKKWPKTNA